MPPLRPLIQPLLRSPPLHPRHPPRLLPQPLLHPSPPIHHPFHPPNHRLYSTPPSSSSSPTDPPTPKLYTFNTLSPLISRPSRTRLLIDVREPRELLETGRIPGAVNMPLTSNPDSFYLGEEEFRERFGFERPKAKARSDSTSKNDTLHQSPFSGMMKEREAGSGLNAEGEKGEEGEGLEEVIFYCKAGVRSRAAARMAREWGNLKVGQYEEGWLGWEGKGGKVER